MVLQSEFQRRHRQTRFRRRRYLQHTKAQACDELQRPKGRWTGDRDQCARLRQLTETQLQRFSLSLRDDHVLDICHATESLDAALQLLPQSWRSVHGSGTEQGSVGTQVRCSQARERPQRKQHLRQCEMSQRETFGLLGGKLHESLAASGQRDGRSSGRRSCRPRRGARVEALSRSGLDQAGILKLVQRARHRCQACSMVGAELAYRWKPCPRGVYPGPQLVSQRCSQGSVAKGTGAHEEASTCEFPRRHDTVIGQLCIDTEFHNRNDTARTCIDAGAFA
jgi:hypothetical protein